MSSATGGGGGGGSAGGGGAVGGALSLMGCVREASPPPQDHHPLSLGDFGMQRSVDTLPKEPKKRRFHPLRGLRRIFRRKSRGAADARLGSRNGDRDADLITRDREEVTLRNPAGRPEEARSRSASELLTDSCDRESVFLRRNGVEESFAKLRGGAGQLSVSHDSVFPGEVPHTRPLSSLDPLATLERGQTKASDEGVHKDYSSRVQHSNRISLRVLEQIKTVIENRNQLASATSTESTHASHLAAGERYQQETTENRFTHFGKHERTVEETTVRVTRNSEDVIDRETPTPKEDLPQLECGSLSHTAAHHRISVRPKNRRPPRRAAISSSASGSTITTITESSDAPDSLEHLTSSGGSSPVEAKTPTGLRKSSSRLSRNSDIFEELETKLPARKPASSASLSPDSLDSSNANGRSNQELSSEPEEPREAKPVARKPSNRVSKGSDVYEELEAKLPRRRSSSSRLSKSPDSLESSSFSKSNETSSSFVKSNEMSPSFVKTNEMSSSYAKLNEMNSSFTKLNEMNSSFTKSNEVFDKLVDVDESRHSRKLQSAISKSTEGFEKLMDRDESRHSRKLQSAISKSTEGFDKLMDYDESRHSRKLQSAISKSTEGFEKLDHVEIRPVSRRLHGHQMSKSIEGFDKLVEDEETKLRTPARRFSSVVASKSSEAPLKAADSLEAMETMEASDDSMERRRSSFEFRPRKSPPKLISMSSENFEALDHGEPELRRTELQKRSSISDVNLSRGRRYSKAMSKSTESFEAMDVGNKEEESNGSSAELGKGGCWRSAKRVARLSSESSDNLELDDRLENRRARRAPKRIPSTSVVDIFPTANHGEDERRPTPTRKPPRLQKSSESSELGSTDTLDSERRNRSDSTETLDSLEKDADREPRDDEATDDNAPEKCDKNNSWSAKTTTDMNSAVSDSTEDSNRAPSSPDKSYWRQTSDSKENIDIRQLLAITIVTRMADNGNNQRNNSVAYPKKQQQQQQQQQQLQQQQQQLSSPPSSPVVQQEDNKMLFNNLLASKNDEDLQNMLNGNISEVSTDTKSFKEKLIMFEKLGK